jgi:hypothetical protein
MREGATRFKGSLCRLFHLFRSDTGGSRYTSTIA